MLTCFECAKTIKTQAIVTSSPLLHIRLGIDFQKAFHPKCYEKAEAKAAIELKGEKHGRVL